MCAPCPPRDRIMLVRADALTTPATAFEPDRKKLEEAIADSQPGSTALNLDQALAFARQIQTQSGRRAGEVVFVGTGQTRRARTGQAGPAQSALPERAGCSRKLRFAAHRSTPFLGRSRRLGDLCFGAQLRRGAAYGHSGADLRPFGSTVPAICRPDPSALTLAPGADREASFQFRTRAAGFLQAQLLPHDAFPADDQATLQLPSQPALRVTVYSAEPDLLRPVLAASPQVVATFRAPAEYSRRRPPGRS